MPRRIRELPVALTPEQRKHFRRVREEVEAEKPQILEQAKQWFAEAEARRGELRELVRPLKERRERGGVSLEEIATGGRFEADEFRRLEDGDPRIGLSTLVRYAEALGKEVRLSFVDAPVTTKSSP